MRTIGKRHPKRTPGGDYLSQCWECRAPTLRSRLIRRSDGNLYHRTGGCQPSKVGIELDRGNAERSRQRRHFPPMEESVSLDGPTFETLGQPENPLVAWAWINWIDGTLRDGANCTVTKVATGDFELQCPVAFDFAMVTHFDTARHTGGHLPLLLHAGKTGEKTLKLRCRNRFDGAVGIDKAQFMVLLYGDGLAVGQGAYSMLTTVAAVWVKGSDASIIDLWEDGAPVTAVKNGTGLWTLTLGAGFSYRFASISQYVVGDPSSATPIFTGVGQLSGHEAGVVIHLTNGNLADGDFCVRFLK